MSTEIKTATSMIVAACDIVFESGWQSHLTHLRTQYVQYQQACQLALDSAAQYPLYQHRGTDAETYFFRLLNGFQKGSPYTDMKATARTHFRELCHAMYSISKHGIDAYAAKERAAYIDSLTAYLRLSLDKKAIHAHPSATDIHVNGSAKGYKVSALVDGSRLVTDCIPVGGYNIVAFHYRYTVKFN